VVGCDRGPALRLDRLGGQRLSPVLEDAPPIPPGEEAADDDCHAERRPSNRDADDPAYSHGVQTDDRGSGCDRGATGVRYPGHRIVW